MAAPELAPSNDAGIIASSIQQKILRSHDGCIPTPVFQSIELILTGTTIPVNCFPGARICNLVINDTNASDQPVPTTTGATTHKSLLSPIPGVATTALQTLVHQTLPQCRNCVRGLRA